jgi:hypothetical protein
MRCQTKRNTLHLNIVGWAWQCSQSSATIIQSTINLSYNIKINFNIIHPITPSFFKRSPPLQFPNQNCVVQTNQICNTKFAVNDTEMAATIMWKVKRVNPENNLCHKWVINCTNWKTHWMVTHNFTQIQHISYAKIQSTKLYTIKQQNDLYETPAF